MQKNKFRKGLVIAVIFLFFGASITPNIRSVGGTIIYVPDDYPTIQAAVNAAVSGDTIIVRDGTYIENVDVNKKLTIQSENGYDMTVVKAADSGSPIFQIIANYVNITGFTVCGSSDSYGIYINYIQSCNISENVVSNNSYGIYLCQSSNNMVRENIVLNNTFGIRLTDWSSYNNILNNTVTSQSYSGISLNHHSVGNTIIKNMIKNNNYGVTASGRDANDNVFYLNNFIENFRNAYTTDQYYNIWNSSEMINYMYLGQSYTWEMGNYWDDYTGNDINGDGIGDSAYIPLLPSSIDKDYFPLMEPFENYFAWVEGIDVSHYQNEQGDIDWVKVYNSGKRFTFAKATGGTGWKDDYFMANMDGGTNASVLMAAYHFAYPEYNNASDEAQFFLSVAGNYLKVGYLRPALDIEDDPAENSYPYRLGKENLSNWIHEFMSIVEIGTGIEPILYVNSNYANNYLNNSINKYDLWIAHYDVENPNTGIWDDWDFWQYSDQGYAPGISGKVDLNLFNGNVSRLDSFMISNANPGSPVIDGESNGKAGVEYEYTFNAVDPDGHDVKYFIDWGDSNTEWTEYGDSGKEIKLKHTWDEQGDFTIKAKAKDIFDAESEWGTLEVTMPKNKPFFYNSPLLNWLVERFPLFQRLLIVLGVYVV